MDDIVKAALKKWPNVPHCFGWLALDARGQWWMRDERAQAAGLFASNAASKGAVLKHEKLIDFIGRNYGVDELGQWFFQNGPQRVYVELELTPWVWRVDASGALVSHTGLSAQPIQSYVDEEGRLYLQTDLGFGVVHSQDMVYAAEALDAGRMQEPETLARTALLLKFSVVRSPNSTQATSSM